METLDHVAVTIAEGVHGDFRGGLAATKPGRMRQVSLIEAECVSAAMSEAGAMLENTVKEKRERIGRMFQMHANSREQINEAYAGDIVAIVGLKDTTTGDTLSDVNHKVIL